MQHVLRLTDAKDDTKNICREDSYTAGIAGQTLWMMISVCRPFAGRFERNAHMTCEHPINTS